MKDVFKYSFIALILLLTALILPIGGGIFYFLSCLPIVYLGLVRGLSIAYIAFFIVVMMLFFGISPIMAVVYGFFFVFIILFWYIGIKKKYSADYMIFGSALLFSILGIGIFLGLQGYADRVIIREAGNVISIIEEQTRLSGLKNDMIPVFVNYFLSALPGILFLSVVISFGITYKIAEWIFRKSGILIEHFNVNKFKPSDFLIWGLIISGYMYWISSRSNLFQVKTVSINLGVIFLGIYLLAGLSLISYYLDFYRSSFVIRVIAYLLLLWQPVVLIILGVTDVWLDLRSRTKTIRRTGG